VFVALIALTVALSAPPVRRRLGRLAGGRA
jgi:hypothetical protein